MNTAMQHLRVFDIGFDFTMGAICAILVYMILANLVNKVFDWRERRKQNKKDKP
jgi:uncharacterized membrane protein